MKKLLIGGLVVSSLLYPIRAFAYDDGGDYGNDNDQRRCYHAENCRGSFSPGPFDRSPVDAFNNNCLPGATCYYGDPKKKDQQPSENK